MQMFLTRLGFGSKIVVTGDVTQIDLPRGQSSGLIEVQKILADIEGTEDVDAALARHADMIARIAGVIPDARLVVDAAVAARLAR